MLMCVCMDEWKYVCICVYIWSGASSHRPQLVTTACVCMYVCMYVFMYVYIYCVYLYSIRAHNTRMYVCMYVCDCRIFICVNMYVFVCVYEMHKLMVIIIACMCVSVYVCVYASIRMYICRTHTLMVIITACMCVCMYTYTHRKRTETYVCMSYLSKAPYLYVKGMGSDLGTSLLFL